MPKDGNGIIHISVLDAGILVKEGKVAPLSN
jgi:hypothetical protein